jgi:hypothetical protein
MIQEKALGKLKKVDPDTFELVYPAMCGGSRNPKKKCGSNAGMNGKASPACCFPATAVTLGYSVYFPADFNFQDSGKLPGLWIGDSGASGGSWLPKGGSVRVMWRNNAGKSEPHVVAYLYIPTEVGGSQKNAVKKQNFTKVQLTGGTGVDLWRLSQKKKMGADLPIKKGGWNAVTLTVGINGSGKSDGYVTLGINGKSKTVNGMTWSTSGLKINGIMMTSWFGGSDVKKYGSPKDERVQFRDFWVKKL